MQAVVRPEAAAEEGAAAAAAGGPPLTPKHSWTDGQTRQGEETVISRLNKGIHLGMAASCR